MAFSNKNPPEKKVLKENLQKETTVASLLPEEKKQNFFTFIGKKIHDYGVLVMFQHTIFSFSFGLISLVVAAKGIPKLSTLIPLLIALLAARTGANGINRVIDAKIDEKNPRTAKRQIPRGTMSKKEALLFSLACFAVMLIACGFLNTTSLLLSPIALFFMIIYSYTKRFTAFCHLILGFTCAMAPAGAWIGVTGSFSLVAFFLSLANMCWVCGFDIIYGAQDEIFDRENGIHSLPAAVGLKDALTYSTLLHGLAFLALVCVGLLVPEFTIIYFLGLLVVGILLIVEHSVVRPGHLQHAEIASYSVNEIISIVFLVAGLLDYFL